ncbi:hypothetical protein [Cronobacter turicensis]|uniref:hypothetical protein n=1 Tax=Cronobacter turicensis TaxID=413502 RepID=UPI0024C36839|nr:hypothetical protein [Cronobacter turicensis]MDK1236299.1 hypothetical protein [Cronobacter turicensis]
MTAKNPTEHAISKLELSWLDQTDDPGIKLIVWRVTANGERLLNAFFALQQHPEGRSVPDLFVTLDTPFDTGYGYSQALARDFLESLEATPDARPWDGEHFLPCYHAGALCALLDDFARAHQDDFRHAIVILNPYAVSDVAAFTRWLTQWLAAPAQRVRLLLTDTTEQPLWQPLVKANASQVRLLVDEPDVIQVMQQTARQQSDPDSDRLLFRRYLADAMLLLERGSAAQVASRVALAMPIAQRRGWADQEAVLHHLTAGAWLKEKNTPQAVAHYQQAQTAATRVADDPARGQLAVQGAFGEAGAWFADKNYTEAAKHYRRAATLARAIPHPLFELEGHRMAGFALWQAGHRTVAMDDYAAALRAAKAIAPEERAQTTLPLVFGDLLRMHDKRRSEALETAATRYQQTCQQLILEAEAAVSQHAAPGAEAVNAADRRLQLRLEAAFLALRQQREALIEQGDDSVRQTVRLARDMLHPHWNGLPDVAHPFDAPPGEWQSLPAWSANAPAAPISESAGSANA